MTEGDHLHSALKDEFVAYRAASASGGPTWGAAKRCAVLLAGALLGATAWAAAPQSTVVPSPEEVIIVAGNSPDEASRYRHLRDLATRSDLDPQLRRELESQTVELRFRRMPSAASQLPSS